METSTPHTGRGFQAALAARGITGAAGAVKLAATVVAPLICLLGVLGAIGSFTTIRHLAIPWFRQSAWIVPAGIDTGIVALLAWDLLAEYLGLSWPVLRWTAWAFIAATTYLNITAAHGDPTASIMHAAMPVLFITVVEGIRHLVRQGNRARGRHPDRTHPRLPLAARSTLHCHAGPPHDPVAHHQLPRRTPARIRTPARSLATTRAIRALAMAVARAAGPAARPAPGAREVRCLVRPGASGCR